MRIACVQHVPFEGPAAIADWARERGNRIDAVHAYRGDPLPEASAIDALVVMGGPMGAGDDAAHPWLAPTRALMLACVDEDLPVLGVCLGAQLLARALGARVYPAREREIGWLAVERLPAAAGTPLESWPASPVPLHWHGDTFELPPGAVQLARTGVCEQQAFALGSALGLQFHVEATPASVEALVEACAQEIGDGPHEQPGEAIRAAARERCAAVRPLLDATLDELFGR